MNNRILDRIRFWLDEYRKENGIIHDDEYPKLFTKYYLKVIQDNDYHAGWCSSVLGQQLMGMECDCSSSNRRIAENSRNKGK